MKTRLIPYNPALLLYRTVMLHNHLCHSTYKNVFARIVAILIFLNLTLRPDVLQAQRLTRDLNVVLLTNQVGYLPASAKTCLMKGTEKKEFEVVEITSGHIAYRGTLLP